MNTPDHAQIAVTADWGNCGEGVDIPASWNIAIGNYAGTETYTENENNVIK